MQLFSHIFAITNQLPGLVNAEEFFNVMHINGSTYNYSFKHICLCKIEFELFQLISQHRTVGRDFNI